MDLEALGRGLPRRRALRLLRRGRRREGPQVTHLTTMEGGGTYEQREIELIAL